MSLHRRTDFPRPEQLVKALKAHGLEHDAPSQLADAFRLGWKAFADAGEPSALEIQTVEELAQLGYTVRDGLLYPPATLPQAPASNSRFGKLSAREALNRFLDTAAAEGYVFAEIDAADLYVALFPDEYERAPAIPAPATKPEPASALHEPSHKLGFEQGQRYEAERRAEPAIAPSEGAAFDPVAEQTAHDEWWTAHKMDAHFSLTTMNQSRAAWKEGVRRAMAAPALQESKAVTDALKRLKRYAAHDEARAALATGGTD